MTRRPTRSSSSTAPWKWTTLDPSRSQPALPTADPAASDLAVVAFGLASAVSWGAGDFGGGWTGRRASVFAIAIVVDLLGAVVMVPVALATHESFPGSTTLVLSTIAGICAVAGIVGLYQGLALGRMGVVAPVTGLLAATLPVIVGFAGLGLPAPPVLIGILAAFVAVILVSRGSDPAGRPSGIRYALVAGVGLGLFNVAVAAFPEHLVAWPLVVIKLASLIAISIVVVVTGRSWRLPTGLLPAAMAVAVLDLAGNGFYVLATQAGRIDVAATLSSLYPVTTVVLAVALLRERVSRTHVIGIVLAALAIALIAGGSAAAASVTS